MSLNYTLEEQAMLAAFKRGEEFDLFSSDASQNDARQSGEWGAERTVRAEVVAQLLLNPPRIDETKPIRFRLSGARVSGLLDVGCGHVSPFLFSGCRFDEAPFLNDSNLEFAGFTDCVVPGIHARRVRCTGSFWLGGTTSRGDISFEDAALGDIVANGLTVEGPNHGFCLCGSAIEHDLVVDLAVFGGTLCFSRARIAGQVSMSGTRIANSSSDSDARALYAREAKVGGGLFIGTGFTVKGPLNLEGVSIGGKLVLDGFDVKSKSTDAVVLDHVRVGLGLFFQNATITGGVRMHHASIGCQAAFDTCSIDNARGDALRADHLHVDGALLFGKSIKLKGSIDLHGAYVECHLDMDGVQIELDQLARWGVRAQAMRVQGDFTANKATVSGGITLADSHISGTAEFSGALIETSKAPALDCSRVRIDASLELDKKFEARGGVKLTNAKVGTFVDLSNSTLSNQSSRALDASGLGVSGGIFAREITVQGAIFCPYAKVGADVRFTDAALGGTPANTASIGVELDPQTGESWRGFSLVMNDAEILGDIDLKGTNCAETLNLKSARVARTLILRDTTLRGRLTAANLHGLNAERLELLLRERPVGLVDLSSAHTQYLCDSSTSWPVDVANDIDGFVYESVDSDMALSERLRVLKRSTGGYNPQPYEQLAATLTAKGDSDAARTVNLASLREEHRSGSFLLRSWGKLQDLLVGYGYLPGRALAVFLLLWLSAVVFFTYGIAPCGTLSYPGPGICPVKGDEHPTWDPWIYSLDLLLPLSLGHDTAWDPTGLAKAFFYILSAAGWGLTAVLATAAARTLKRQ